MANPKTSRPRTLTHLDAKGRAKMVDVGAKDVTVRTASARGWVRADRTTITLLREGRVPKGDVFAVARIAGIQAAKRTPELVPLCHAIALTGCEVTFSYEPDGERVRIDATTRARDRTGVEMEALAAVSVAALTMYDMLKAVDRAMVIERIELVSKTGGKSGAFTRRSAKS